MYYESTLPSERKAFKAAFDVLTSSPFAPAVKYDREIEVWGRKLRVPKSSSVGEGIAWFTFQDLCGGFRGAADYIEVTKQFGTIFVSLVSLSGIAWRGEDLDLDTCSVGGRLKRSPR